MHILVLYHSFTGQAARVAREIEALATRQGSTVTACQIDFADEAERRSTPVDLALIGRWADAAKKGIDYPVSLSVDLATVGPVDLVFLLSNTWSFSPAVPIQSFLRSDEAEILGGKPVAIGIVCRGFWRKNLAKTRALVEQHGGRIVGHEVFDHPGSWLGSTITNLFGMTKERPLPTRWGPLRLPAFGISPEAMRRVPKFYEHAVGHGSS